MLREWIVTLYRHEDLESFYEDMETPGGNLFIPNRRVDLVKRRPMSRNTHYMLTNEEAELLKLDENSVHTDSYAEYNMPMEMFEQSKKFSSIIEYGRGIFVSPKPNRLVLINKNVIHGVTRVDSDAGENVRVSLTGGIWDH
jgi:hypothetical protein